MYMTCTLILALYLSRYATWEHIEQFSEWFHARLAFGDGDGGWIRWLGGNGRELIRGGFRTSGGRSESKLKGKSLYNALRRCSSQQILRWITTTSTAYLNNNYLPGRRGGISPCAGFQLGLQILNEFVIGVCNSVSWEWQATFLIKVPMQCMVKCSRNLPGGTPRLRSYSSCCLSSCSKRVFSKRSISILVRMTSSPPSSSEDVAYILELVLRRGGSMLRPLVRAEEIGISDKAEIHGSVICHHPPLTLTQQQQSCVAAPSIASRITAADSRWVIFSRLTNWQLFPH